VKGNLRSSQGGGALIAAIFLIVVVATLGAFAIRTGMDQQYMASLSWMEARADAAAYSGLEFASDRLSGGATACPSPIFLPPGSPGMNGFSITLQCVDLSAGANTVYQITATAVHGNFGNSDYVRRIRTRRVSRIGPAGNW
jgi:MSHA biogenesis protein MshP